MSRLVLDEQLNLPELLPRIRRWSKVQSLRDVVPEQRVFDDRVPVLLLTLNQPTFITIDQGFWNRRWCNPNYCILCFALRDDQQDVLPSLLRAVLKLPQFATRAVRMGKVVRVGRNAVEYWDFHDTEATRLPWKPKGRKR